MLVTVPTAEPITALTFDDGPHPDTTPALLEQLDRHGARATFFLIGERARSHPQLVAAIVGGGHELGNHLMRDRPSVALPAETFREELRATSEILHQHGEVRWWRPGSGFFTSRMVREAQAQGLRGALGSPWLLATTYTGDSRRRGARLARRTHPGAIAVFHEGTRERSSVGQLVDGYLEVLAQRGLAATTLSDLQRSG